MRSPTNKTIDDVVSYWRNEPIVYICDAIGGINEIIQLSSIPREHKDVLLKLVLSAQSKANKMEDAIISKNYLLKSEGYIKCPHCGGYGKPLVTYESGFSGRSFSCCGVESTF